MRECWQPSPWLADDVTDEEWRILYYLNDIASRDLELAKRLADLPWFADDVTYNKGGILHALKEVASKDLKLARLISSLPKARETALVMGSLARIADREPDAYARLTAQPWFADGLDDEEAALLVALEDAAVDARNLFTNLVRSHSTQSKSVSLPLTGDVRLWAIQSTPFPRGKDLVGMLEEAVGAAEGFMGTPFPITDVILVVSPVVSETRGYGGQFRGDHIRLVRYEYDQINRGVIHHEVAHYYFQGGLGPTWLVEGGAEFMVAYIKDRVGLESLEVRKPTTRILLGSNCFHQGVTTISQLNERLREQPDPVQLCNYSLGAYFLHALFDALGEEATSAALRELFLLHKSRVIGLPRRRYTRRF